MSLHLLMFSGDRDVARGRLGPFDTTLAGLAEAFDRIDVLTPRVRGGEPRVLHARAHIHPSPASRLLHMRWLVRHALALARERPYHLLVSHDYGLFANGLAARVVSARTGIPYVSEIHHIPAHPKRAQWWEPLAQLGYRGYVRWIATRARAIRVVNARDVPDLLARWGVSRERLLVLPSAYLDLEVFTPGDEPKRYALGFVGRLVANKNLRYVAAVFEAVARADSDAGFLVVGSGPEEGRLRVQLERAGIAERVTLIPWLEGPAALASAYRQMHALLCPSLSEGGPRVCLEAMACGVPVFGTPVGVMPETIVSESNGWLLPWSPADGAALVVRLLRQPQALAAAGQAARTASLRFDRRAVLTAYAQAYRALALERPA